ncbi:MAG TPA: hypothetical protein PLQ65_15005 [Flavihumibacter sp.]|nr:hypothetical protein [Bacteroidota bacterium]HOA38379.1 hypothetical protein [Flavihumibacter sp.]HQD10977.1 hypothetical protein [Flavihumibacter sp.]
MTKISRQFIAYLNSSVTGNFIGFAIGMASARLVSHFFTTRSIRNLWGLTAKKTVVDKDSFHFMEWAVSLLIGFLVFELISKWIKKKMDEWLPKSKWTRWLVDDAAKG